MQTRTLTRKADTAPEGRRMAFAAGEHLFHQGDSDCGLHKILTGTVTVYRVTADGYRQIEAFAGPGEYVSLCLSATSSTSAEALTAVETTCLGRDAFERRLLEDAAFRAEIFHDIDRSATEARRHATLLACRCALDRVARFALFLEQRFAADAAGYTPIPMSRADIADHLGLTLETVSRMLSRLKQRGLIDLPRPDRFRVANRPGLVRLIHGDPTDRDDRCGHSLAG